MAKRSDFAQKLLDDLRLRKKKMAMGASGQYSAQAPSNGNAYGTSRWDFRGSEANTSSSSNKSIPNTEVTKIWLGARHHRTPSTGTSQEIVPLGRTRNKEQSVDVSMALALALSNTGKLQNIELFSNATVGKKQIMHHGSLNLREKDINQFAFFSPMQIGDISGVNHLNMILKACSNGIIFSRDSINIERELLKGAIDLEESLKMLVTLQDASDYMVASKGNKIKLLKGKEDEKSSKEAKDRGVMKPIFSFDRPSKHSHNHVQEGNSSHSNKSSLKVVNFSTSTSIKRADPKGEFVNEKVRIPNVVAKLMGLEELPLTTAEVRKVEIQNVPEPKQVRGMGRKEANETTHSIPKVKGHKKGAQERGHDETKVMKSLEAVHSKVKKNIKDLHNSEYQNPLSTQVPHFSIIKQEDFAVDHIKEIKEAKKEKIEVGEKASARLRIFKEQADHTFVKHEKTQRNTDAAHKQQRNAQEVYITVKKQQQPAISRLKNKHTVDENQEKMEYNTRDKRQPTIETKKEVKTTEIFPRENKTQKEASSWSNTTRSVRLVIKQSKVNQKDNHKEKQKLRNRNNGYQMKAVAKGDNEKIVPQILAPAIRKPKQDPSTQEVEVSKMMTSRNANNSILIDGNTRVKVIEAKDQNLKERTLFLQELEQRWKERTGKAEAVGAGGMNSESHPEQKTVAMKLTCSPDDNEIPRLIDQINMDENNVEAKQENADKPMQIDDTMVAPSAATPPQTSYKEDLELITISLENKLEGPADGKKLSNYNSVGEVDGQHFLTKDEHILKQILINSQYFLNTAQALFKIKVPVDVLQASENTRQDEHFKLVLDSAYEIMRRTSKKEEVLSFRNQFFAPVNVRCLDELIKELNQDLKSMEFPCKDEGADYDTAECLHMMIERDVLNRNPVLNCMWDIGWNSIMSAIIDNEDIVREIEKCVLNGLINDLARDLMSVSTSV